MVEKYSRRRSKSASRKRRSRSTSKTKPIILPREKRSIDGNEKASDSEVHIEKRITRQSKLDETISRILLKEIETINETKVESVSSFGEIRVEEKKPKLILSPTQSFGRSLETFGFCLIALLLIPFVIYLNKICENRSGIRFVNLNEFRLEYFTNCTFIGVIVSWLAFLGVLAHIPFGRIINSKIKNGIEVKYCCNGVFSMIMSVLCLSGLVYLKYINVKMVYENYYHLIGSSITVALFLSFLILVKSYFTDKSQFSFHPVHLFYNFIVGHESNPRILGLDLKFFYEFRPGFISWMVLNIIFCLKDFEEHKYESINYSLLFCAIGQIVYCVDALMFEADIVSKSFMLNGQFGFFHCFGNQVIVPFLFTLTTRSIQINKFQLPIKCLIGIAVINFIGYVIYRTANIQKNSFRKNPYSVHLCHLKTLTNRHGRQLLVGGWWGLLRHPNYLGDIIMSLSWSMYAGLHSGVCWFYPIYFLVFIIIRCIQDDRKCAIEHETTWSEYRNAVPYRLLPFIF